MTRQCDDASVSWILVLYKGSEEEVVEGFLMILCFPFSRATCSSIALSLGIVERDGWWDFWC